MTTPRTIKTGSIIPPTAPTHPIVETITPSKAQDWLDNFNTHNRPLRPKTIERYANAIKSGQWELNGETIIFSTDGVLLDGQHRLKAVIMAGKAIQSFVIRGVSPSVFDTIDVGANRASRDMLAIDGEVNSSCLAAAARIVYLHFEIGNYLDGHASRWSSLVTPRDVVETVARYPELRNSVAATLGNDLRKFFSPGQAAYLHFLFNRIDPADCEKFFDKIRTGSDLSENHPILHLRNALVTAKSGTLQERAKKIAYAIKAWNFFRKKRSIKRIEWSVKNDNFPTPE